MNHKAKTETGKLLGALSAFLLSAVILLALGAWAAGISRLGERGLSAVSGAIQFLCVFLLVFILRRGRGGKVLPLAGICALCCAAVSLALGFLIDSDRVSLTGLLRVLLTCSAGAVFGAGLPGGKRSGKGRRGLKKIRLF